MEDIRTSPETARTSDRRSERRNHSLKGARIVFNHGSSSFSCVVRDLSADGAKLVVSSVIGIPRAFDLRFDDGTQPRHCSVQWASEKTIGVHFDSAVSFSSVGQFGHR
jgi:hypothetical protein